MRIVWAIPCYRVVPRGDGLLDLLAAPVDSIVVPTLPVAVQIDVAVHLKGPELDFQTEHEVEVVLSGPDLVEHGRLRLPVGVREPGPNRVPGYEISANVGTRIEFVPDREGGYDLSFALDGVAEHSCTATVSVVVSPEATGAGSSGAGDT